MRIKINDNVITGDLGLKSSRKDACKTLALDRPIPSRPDDLPELNFRIAMATSSNVTVISAEYSALIIRVFTSSS